MPKSILRILVLLLIPLLIANQSSADISPSQKSAHNVGFDTQALSLPILLGMWSSLAPLPQARIRRATAQQIAQLIDGSVTGWRWVPLDYLEATLLMLKDLKNDPETYDLLRIRRIQFVPWMLRWIYSVRDALGLRAIPGRVTLIAHWHPRLFVQDLRYKLGNISRNSEVTDLIAKGWTLATSRSFLGGLLFAQLGFVALTATGFVWAIAPVFWPGIPLTVRILGVIVGPAVGVAFSFATHGMVERAVHLIQGRKAWVLDPAKPAMLRPISSLADTKTYLKHRIAAEMPQVSVVRSFSRSIALSLSVVAHIVVLTWLLSFDGTSLLSAVIFIGLLMSAGITLWRLARAPSVIQPLPVRQVGTLGEIQFILRQITAQFMTTLQEGLRWVLPWLVIFFAADPFARAKARELFHEVEAPHQFLVTPEAPKKHYRVQVIPLAPPKTDHPGQGGKALDYMAPPVATPYKPSKPTQPKFVAPPPSLVIPRVITTVEAPELSPSPMSAAQLNIPLQAGLGGQKIFEWEKRGVRYFAKDYEPPHQKVVLDPFAELTKEEANAYRDYITESYFHVDGDIAGVRLYIDSADDGGVTISFFFILGDGRFLSKSMDVPIMDWGPQSADGKPQPIDFWFDKNDFTLSSPGPHTPLQSLELSARTRPTNSPVISDDKKRSMRIKVGKVEFLTEEDRKNQTAPVVQPPPPAAQMHALPQPLYKVPEHMLFAHAA